MEFTELSIDVLGNMSYELMMKNDELIDSLGTQFPVLDSVRNIRIKIINILHLRLNHLINTSGGLNDVGELMNPDSEELVYSYLIQEQEANKMRSEIFEVLNNSNISGLNNWITLKDAKDIPVFANDPNQSKKSFAELNFGNRKLYQAIHSFEELILGFLIEEQTFMVQFLAQEKSM